MTFRIIKEYVWAGVIPDRPDALAERLRALHEGSLNLEMIIGRRDWAGQGMLFVSPLRTIVEMLESGGDPVGYTVVYDGEIHGKNVTGTLGSASVTIASAVIPTVSEWGLIAMTLLLLAAATIVLRRRRAITT